MIYLSVLGAYLEWIRYISVGCAVRVTYWEESKILNISQNEVGGAAARERH